MKIRRANNQDKAELTRLIKVFEDSTQKFLSPEQAAMRDYTDFEKMVEAKVNKYLSRPEYIVFVADYSGVLRGYCSGEIQEKKFRVYGKAGYVANWFVEDSYQSHGVGKKMFDALIKEFEKAKCTHLALDTNIENIRAIKIYEHMGFKKRQITFFKPLIELR